MRFKSFLIALPLSLACFIPRIAFADTLELTGVVSSNVTDGVYTYPYIFSINSNSSLTDLSCLSYSREIQVGESWNVNITNLGSLLGSLPTGSLDSFSIDGATDRQLREDAYLDSLYGTAPGGATDSEIQFAIWNVQDLGGTGSGYDAASIILYNLAVNIAPNENAAFLNQFTLYTPVTPQGTQNLDGHGEPQQFLQYNPGPTPVPPPAATPEPSSLILMGTGLLGMAATIRRRLQA